jgi:hypothetical protein
MTERSNTPLAEETAAQAAERIYHEWDAALGAKDLDDAMRLYAPDCLLESPLVRHLLGAELGIVEGRESCGNSCALSLIGNPEHGNGIAKDSSRTGIS